MSIKRIRNFWAGVWSSTAFCVVLLSKKLFGYLSWRVIFPLYTTTTQPQHHNHTKMTQPHKHKTTTAQTQLHDDTTQRHGNTTTRRHHTTTRKHNDDTTTQQYNHNGATTTQQHNHTMEFPLVWMWPLLASHANHRSLLPLSFSTLVERVSASHPQNASERMSKKKNDHGVVGCRDK